MTPPGSRRPSPGSRGRLRTSGWPSELAVEPAFVEDVLFHCQQTVEKALKAFLAWHDRPLRKTHDLVEGEAA
jgi:hypothetical protein